MGYVSCFNFSIFSSALMYIISLKMMEIFLYLALYHDDLCWYLFVSYWYHFVLYWYLCVSFWYHFCFILVPFLFHTGTILCFICIKRKPIQFSNSGIIFGQTYYIPSKINTFNIGFNFASLKHGLFFSEFTGTCFHFLNFTILMMHNFYL